MIKNLYVVGYPSRVGGADTELDHQIHCWQALGVEVHLVPTGPLDANSLALRMDRRGCVVHAPCDWSVCRGQHVISYCNGEFLSSLEQIRRFARTTTFVNCMCWLFEKEKQAHARGWIDYFLYQTDHARLRVQDELLRINPAFRWHRVRPYFHAVEFPFFSGRAADRFRFGRISREDCDKFHRSQVWIYETMVAPVLKEGHVLGMNDEIRKKCGKEPNWITCHRAGAVPVKDVYRRIECVIQMSDTYENLPRVGFEAMASGCLLIVDNRGGWKELVQHKQTGFLCDDEREFVYYASRAAFEPEERRQMTLAARRWLDEHWGLESAKREWRSFFDVLAKH